MTRGISSRITLTQCGQQCHTRSPCTSPTTSWAGDRPDLCGSVSIQASLKLSSDPSCRCVKTAIFSVRQTPHLPAGLQPHEYWSPEPHWQLLVQSLSAWIRYHVVGQDLQLSGGNRLLVLNRAEDRYRRLLNAGQLATAAEQAGWNPTVSPAAMSSGDAFCHAPQPYSSTVRW